MSLLVGAAAFALLIPSALFAQASTRNRAAPTRVGPPSGTVIVVGGGSLGPEIYREFIAAAGGPDALIITVPNSGGADTYDQNAGASQAFRRAGAKTVHVLHTRDRKLADTDSFVAIVRRAGGVWFDGGRQWNLVADYAGTKTEAAFNEVLARGGVVGGSSAGASILGDFLVRGAPSSNNAIMDHPEYRKGFSYLRNVAVDQHVVARERLADLADSIIPRYPHLLGISEDEGTAWVIKGDTGQIIGRGKAFVYGSGVANDPGVPFLTLHPGDVYNLAERRVMRRAIEGSGLTMAFIDSLFAKYQNPAAGGATVLVARKGEVLVNRSYGIPVQPKYTPTTTTPPFAVGGIGTVFQAICDQLPAQAARAGGGRGRGSSDAPPPTPLQSCVSRVGQPVGMQRTTATTENVILSNVDALYRMALGIENPASYRDVDHTRGWQADTVAGVARFSAHVAPGGKRGTFVRVPSDSTTIIVLTNDDLADANGIADRITERLGRSSVR